jgi:ABC-2 type transport system ATP-binding protein
MEPWAIETSNLRKVFHPARNPYRPFHKPKPITAVAGVDLCVRRGELFGLLGPNGAGKTTLIKMLCTLIVPTSGRAQVLGHDLSQEGAIKQSVGLVVSDERSFYWRLSARSNLAFFAAMVGLSKQLARRRVDEVLAAVELGDMAERRFNELSTGMRQRLAIARGLLHRPKLLFMDEPTRSLDPIAAAKLHAFVCELVKHEGVTILLTTHNLTEAESLCDRLALMHRGRIRACASPDQLRRELWPGDQYTLLVDRRPDMVGVSLEGIVSDLHIAPTDDGLVKILFRVDERSGGLMATLDALRAGGLAILGIQRELPTLERAFAHYAETEEPV